MTSNTNDSTRSSCKRLRGKDKRNKEVCEENSNHLEELRSVSNFEYDNIQNPGINSVFDETTGVNYIYITDVPDDYLFSLSDDSDGDEETKPTSTQISNEPQVTNDMAKLPKRKEQKLINSKRRVIDIEKGIKEDSNKLTQVNTSIFSCNNCSCAYDSREELQRHYNMTDQCRRTFTCFLCKYSTEETHVLELHLSFEHNCTEFFTCHHCFYLTGDFQDLKEHIETKHLKFLNIKLTANHSSVNELNSSLIILNENPSTKQCDDSMKCSLYPYSAEDAEASKLHGSFEHNFPVYNNFACDQCSFLAGSQVDLNEHMQFKHLNVVNNNLNEVELAFTSRLPKNEIRPESSQ